MELKRNLAGLGPSPHQKQTSMMQPFINISKASTPVRTRLVPPHAQPSPSPITNNKLVANIQKSPNNKENHHANHHRPEGEGTLFRSGKQFDAENRINLSPILSLNRKLTEGPRFQPKKSLTPEGHKVIADYEGYGPDKRSTFESNFNSLGSMNDSKGSSNYSSASNLRGSNCFKALIDNRAKSPNRF